MDEALQDLEDAFDDLASATADGFPGAMKRLVAVLDDEPLKSLLMTVLPPFDLDEWWQRCAKGGGGSRGPTGLEWPIDRAERVSCQLQLCRQAASKSSGFLDFVYTFGKVGRNYAASIESYCSLVVQPLIRDVSRLAELRPLPPVAAHAISGGFKRTADSQLDALLSEAVAKFLAVSPTSQREGLERLWDAWERSKTILATDKKAGIALLLARASVGNLRLQEHLNSEAKALTSIGNSFQIRHFETDKPRIDSMHQITYLFLRMHALLGLLLNVAPTSDA